MPRPVFVSILFLAGALVMAGGCQAHPRLLSSTPADHAVVAGPAHMELHFSEPLEAAFSGADLVMTGIINSRRITTLEKRLGPLATAIDKGDPKTLILTPRGALASGAYRLDWHAVSTDTHRTHGALSFIVK